MTVLDTVHRPVRLHKFPVGICALVEAVRRVDPEQKRPRNCLLSVRMDDLAADVTGPTGVVVPASARMACWVGPEPEIPVRIRVRLRLELLGVTKGVVIE